MNYRKLSRVIKNRYEGILQPAWDRLEDAWYVKRNPETYEVTWPSSCLEDDLRKAGLL